MDNLIEKGRISASQLMFSVCYYMQGSLLVFGFFSGITKQESWIVIVSGALICLPFIGIYIYLIRQFPGKNLMEINDLVFGKFVGKIISIMYIFFFLSIAAFNLRDVGNFVVGVLMPETPISAVLISFIFICSWAVYKGIQVIVRYSMIMTYLWIVLVFITFILLLTEFELNNYLPIFSLPFSAYMQATHISNAISFNEIVIFMVFLPYVRDKKFIKKSFFSGYILGAFLILLLILRDIPVLGTFVSVSSIPTYESLKMIHVAEIFTRMEILFAILRLIVLFFKISILYYAVVLCVAQLCKLKTYKPLVFVIGSIIISFSLIVFESPIENLIWGKETAPSFSSIFEIVLPLITLIVLLIKKRIKPQTQTNETEIENEQDSTE